MTIAEQFKQYVWIIKTIYNTRRISFEELNERWQDTEMSGGLPMVRATFKRNKQAIQDMFAVNILCDATDSYRYYIENREDLRSPTLQRWMMDLISMSCFVSENLSLHDRILPEVQSYEDDALRTLTEAMKRGRIVEIDYRRYGHAQAKHHSVAPYGLKYRRNRWYLLGVRKDGFKMMLSLDRIVDIDIAEERFEMPGDFDEGEFFKPYFGVIISDESECQRIVLRARGWERDSMRDLPMHCSQREVGRGSDYVDYEIFTHTTSDLIGYILSRASWLEVRSPQTLRDVICLELQAMQARYLTM